YRPGRSGITELTKVRDDRVEVVGFERRGGHDRWIALHDLRFRVRDRFTQIFVIGDDRVTTFEFDFRSGQALPGRPDALLAVGGVTVRARRDLNKRSPTLFESTFGLG